MTIEDKHMMANFFNNGFVEKGLMLYAQYVDPHDTQAVEMFINSLTLVDRNFTEKLKPHHDKIYNTLFGNDVMRIPNYRCALRLARYEMLYVDHYAQQHQNI